MKQKISNFQQIGKIIEKAVLKRRHAVDTSCEVRLTEQSGSNAGICFQKFLSEACHSNQSEYYNYFCLVNKLCRFVIWYVLISEWLCILGSVADARRAQQSRERNGWTGQTTFSLMLALPYIAYYSFNFSFWLGTTIKH